MLHHHPISIAAVGALLLATGQANAGYNLLEFPSLGGTFSGVGGINSNGTVVGYSYTAGNASQRPVIFTPTGPIELGGLTPGGFGQANAINDQGVIVGQSFNGAHVEAFVWDGSMTGLGIIAGDSTSAATGVNATGQIVGQSSSFNGSTGSTRMFSSDGLDMTDLGNFNGVHSRATGVNDSGLIVGVASAAASGIGPFTAIYKNGSDPIAAFNSLGGSSYSATAVNDPGQATGFSTLPGDAETHAVIYFGNVTIDLETLGGSFSFGRAINDHGHVVGSSTLAGDSESVAFLYDGSTMIDLNTLVSVPTGFKLVDASAINNAGQIAGLISNGSEFRAVLLTPFSSPSATVAPGGDRDVSVLGGSGAVGGVSANFADVQTPGDFQASYNTVTKAQLEASTTALTFALPGSTVQVWDLVFDGGTDGPITLIFHYDESLLAPGTDEASLRIFHFDGGVWSPLANLLVDTVANTITGQTTSFSPFALGSVSAIPEPATLSLLGLAGLLLRRRR